MSISQRQYQGELDYQRIGQFLVDHHRPGNADGNWFQPTWEYMHGHPYLDASSLRKIGIWEEAGQIVAVAHYESRLGEAFFELSPGNEHLKPEMLAYAEQNLLGAHDDGRRYLHAFINDFDPAFQDLAQRCGYSRNPDCDRPMAQFAIPDPFPPVSLPGGFRLVSLADERDWRKIHRVMWRGFNHPGEPPEAGVAEREKMFATPTYRPELKVMVAAPDGEYASICGMWYEPANHFAYVEPVATDPAYRRMGIGKAAVLEGIRRCAELGATVAYVGSDQLFYQALGFKVIFTSECWVKYFDQL